MCLIPLVLFFSPPPLGSLHVEHLGNLTPLSDTCDPGTLFPNTYTVSCDFWSVKHPHKRTRYSLKIQANPGDEEDFVVLPFGFAKKPQHVSDSSSPDNATWPCIDMEVGGVVNGYSQWASLSLIANNTVFSPMLLQAAYELLQVKTI